MVLVSDGLSSGLYVVGLSMELEEYLQQNRQNDKKYTDF